MGKHLNPRKPRDCIGFRTGKLIVTECLEPRRGSENEGGLWKCLCDCGNAKNVKGNNLRLDKRGPKSCGCAVGSSIAQGGRGRRKYTTATISYQYSRHRCSAEHDNHIPLPKEDWLKIVIQPCTYCGSTDIRCKHFPSKENRFIPLTEEELHLYDVAMNGVDRINSDLGYEVSNCAPCCGMCNIMKKDHTVDAFLKKVCEVYTHSVLKNQTTSNPPTS